MAIQNALNLTTTGIVAADGAGVFTGKTATDGQLLVGSTGVAPVAASLTAPAAGVTITGGAGSITFALADDLAAVEGMATTGLVSRTGASTWIATTITDNAFILGDAGEIPQMLGPGTNGEIPVCVTSGTPNLLPMSFQQGNSCWYTNLSFSHDGSTLTIAGYEGTALAATNPAYIYLPSNATTGEWALHTIIANVTLTESDLTNNLFGTTAGQNWGNDMPFFVVAFADATDANLEWGITRYPHMRLTPAAGADIGDPSAANADEEYSVFSFADITEANYTAKNTGTIGSFTMTKSVTTDVWSFTALGARDGVGKFNDDRIFSGDSGHFGAAAGNLGYGDGGGTWGSFASEIWNYQVFRDNTCFQDNHHVTQDGAFTGTQAVVFCSIFNNLESNYSTGFNNGVYYQDASGSTVRAGNTQYRGSATPGGWQITCIGVRNAGRITLDNIDTGDQIYFSVRYPIIPFG